MLVANVVQVVADSGHGDFAVGRGNREQLASDMLLGSRALRGIVFFQAEDGIRDVAVTGVQTCALPIYLTLAAEGQHVKFLHREIPQPGGVEPLRSEEHTSELQLRLHLVCRLLLEKKKKKV